MKTNQPSKAAEALAKFCGAVAFEHDCPFLAESGCPIYGANPPCEDMAPWMWEKWLVKEGAGNENLDFCGDNSKPAQAEIISAILSELSMAERKHPNWPADPIHAAAILAEEAGEVVQASLELDPQSFWDGCQYLKSAENQVSMPTLFDLADFDQAANQ